MAAANLEDAAAQSYGNMSLVWILDSLKTKLTQFVQACLPLFPESNADARPIANWLTVMYADAQTLPSTNVAITSLSTSAQHMYKCLFLASVLLDQTLISSAQGTALLDAFNAAFPGL